MARFNQTERIGISKVDSAVTEKLEWVFREQPIVDVGLDAIIEKTVDCDPVGKFVALQIKSGDSHLIKSGSQFIYYISNIHKEYWLQLSIPIILVFYLPSLKKIIWQRVDEETLHKTKTKWKITIPLNKELDETSLKELDAIAVGKEKSDLLKVLTIQEEDNLEAVFDHSENLKLLPESTRSINLISDETRKLGENAANMTNTLNGYIALGYSDKDPEVQAALNTLAKQILISSERLKNEIALFSKIFPSPMLSFEILIVLNKRLGIHEHIEESIASIKTIPEGIDQAIFGFKTLRTALIGLPTKYATLKIARKEIIEIVDLLINEVSTAKNIVLGILDRVETVT